MVSGRFKKFVDTQVSTIDTLPLCLPATHATQAYRFDQFLNENQLNCTHCDVFSEELLYFFYGRPAYRAKEQNNVKLEYDWPIVMVFKPETLSDISAVYPFDTGAFHLGIYKNFFHKDSKLSDFLLPANLEYAQKFVASFYKNNDEYFRGDSRKSVEIPSRNFEAQGIHELARTPSSRISGVSSHIRDERSSTVELHSKNTVSLINTMIGIIIPEPYLNDKDVNDAIARWGVEVTQTYDPLHNVGTEAWAGQIYSLTKRIYEECGFR